MADLSANQITHLKLDSIIPFPDANNYLYAYKAGEMGLLDSNGKVIVPFIFDEILNAEKNKFMLLRDGKTIFTSDHFAPKFDMIFDETYCTETEESYPTQIDFGLHHRTRIIFRI